MTTTQAIQDAAERLARQAIQYTPPSIPHAFLDWVFGLSKLTGKDQLTLLAIRRFQGETGANFPTITELARYSGVGRATMHVALKRLKKRGLVRQVPLPQAVPGNVSRWEVVSK
jgi:DNA-binding MarR family transcriptional regulator